VEEEAHAPFAEEEEEDASALQVSVYAGLIFDGGFVLHADLTGRKKRFLVYQKKGAVTDCTLLLRDEEASHDENELRGGKMMKR